MNGRDHPPAVHAEVPAALAGERLDRALAQMFPDYSRTRLQAWLLDGSVRVSGAARRPSDRVAGGERVTLQPPPAPPAGDPAQPMALDIRYQDDAILVLNKPPGVTVHPGAGRPDGTLMNGLLHHDPGLAALPRAGIVHRLDRDTSGLMVVARTPAARTRLVRAIAARRVERHYQAVVHGRLVAGGTCEAPVGRDPRHRVRMAVVPGGRPARTHYRITARYRCHTALAVTLDTGRTHQIRVHLAHLGHPLVGDPTYGGLRVPPRALGAPAREALLAFRRQALHASALRLEHPLSGQPLAFEAPPPADLAALVAALATDAGAG